MEPMRVRVKSIRIGAKVTRAVVTAVSFERHERFPRAAVEVDSRLPSRTGDSTYVLRERIRKEALRFLDVS